MTRHVHEFSRRRFLFGTAAAAMSGAFSGLPAFAVVKTLRDCAAQRGLLFGSSISSDVFRDKAYAELVTGQCGIAVPENALKWAALSSSPGQYDFGEADRLYEFSHASKLQFRGHTLVWEQALPRWFALRVNVDNAEEAMTRHIAQVMGHYAGKFHSWDVVNEAFQIEDGRSDGMKITPWLRFLGPEYIETAFHAARQADPAAMLVYNENWLEPEDAMTERKRQAVLAMLKNLKTRNVPIDALGIQSHIYAQTNVTGPNYRRFLDQVSDLGLKILITEMDVREKAAATSVRERDGLIAEQYFNYLSFVLRVPAVKAVLTWGLSDRHTWISGRNPRPDGLPPRPLPYDPDYKPAPAWDAIRRAFESAPHR